ncbi:DNA internalization-related competence protein ComEC/Rec2 [Zoogloea sp.]|uniref:DNA internalization-related competence protein ComEC/Rec2 n=1 Tax=Zoogloea sp. TaxID=49181 RepID=UPI0026386A53|nr:DNA internalization-related competence protein ComEC/Rec2 [uncultured Zoogloea sp.]
MGFIFIAFALGILACQLGAALPPQGAVGLVAGLAVAGLLGGGVMRVRSRGLMRGLALLVMATAAAGAGWAYAAWRADLRLAEALPGEWEGRDVVVTGVVASLPQDFERGLRFVFEVEESAAPLPQKISLAWYKGFRDEEMHTLPPLHAGERWRLTVRLKRPHGNVNPHGFDYERWLLEQGIRATGYVRPAPDNQRLDAFVPGMMYGVERLREEVRERFRRALPEGAYTGVLVALAVGDQRSIPPELWRVFARTGISHLVAISGMHVTMIAALFAAAVSGLWRRSPALALRWPAQQAGVVAGFLIAFLYCLLAGWGVPAQRTLYMLGCVAFALVLRRETAPGRVLTLALAVVLVLDPWAVMAAGFWLSFGAVALLFLVSSGRLMPDGRLRGALRAQWAVTLGLVPALLVLFQQFSLVSPLANAIAIPLVSFVVTPLAIGFAILPLQMLADLAHGAFALTMLAIHWLAELPWASWQQAAPPAWLAVLATLGCLWALLPRGTPARWVGLAMLLPLLMWAPARPAPGEARVTVLDVGQGLAVHVQTAAHDLIYDTGPAFSADANSGERILLPYLRAGGVRRLDSLVVTHQDNDHSGGAEALLTGIPVAEVRSSLSENHPARLIAGLRHQPCVAGQAWEWDGVRFTMLHPARAADDSPGSKTNDVACVLRVDAAGLGVLLTSDIEAVSEAALLQGQAGQLASDVLVVPHHGSRSSSTAAFIEATRPRWVIFPVGYLNRFRHPNAQVWARWAASGAALWRTDTAGAVRVHLVPGGPRIEAAREATPRYWHGR